MIAEIVPSNPAISLSHPRLERLNSSLFYPLISVPQFENEHEAELRKLSAQVPEHDRIPRRKV